MEYEERRRDRQDFHKDLTLSFLNSVFLLLLRVAHGKLSI